MQQSCSGISPKAILLPLKITFSHQHKSVVMKGISYEYERVLIFS